MPNLNSEKKLTEEEIKKSIEALLEEVEVEEIKEEKKEEVIVKSEEKEEKKTKKDENGGEDKMKSGSPFTEKQNSDTPKMKKSIDELKEFGVSEDELELISAWREELNKEETPEIIEESVTKSLSKQNEMVLADEIKKAISESTAELRKSLNEKDELIKSLSDKVNKLANQPAYDSKGIDTLEAIEKSETVKEEYIQKSQVLSKMLELQAAGKGVTSHHVAEFEATGNISNQKIKNLVKTELKSN